MPEFLTSVAPKRLGGSPQDTDSLDFNRFMNKYSREDGSEYNNQRAFEIYKENPAWFDKNMVEMQDDGPHFASVDPKTGVFLKSKNNPTLQKELDWYNSPEGRDFKSKHDLDTSGEFYRYIPKNSKEASPDDDPFKPIHHKEFASRFRTKYPGAYDDLDDKQLANAFIDTYPEYKPYIQFTDPGSALESGVKQLKGSMKYLSGDIQDLVSNEKIKDRLYERISGDAYIPEDPQYYKDALTQLKKKKKDLDFQYQEVRKERSKRLQDATPFSGIPGSFQQEAEKDWKRQPEYDEYSDKNSELVAALEEVRTMKKLVEKGGSVGAREAIRDAYILPSKGEIRQAKGRAILEEAPVIGEGLGSQAISMIPQMLPMLAAIGLAPFTSGTSLSYLPVAVSSGAMLGLSYSQAGSAMKGYDDYVAEKGIEPDQGTRYGVAMLNGAIEMAMESSRIGRLLPKGMTGKLFARSLMSSNPKFAKSVMGRYLKAKPGAAKKIAEVLRRGPGEEGLEELFTQIGQDFTQLIYKNPEDWPTVTEFIKNGVNALKAGAMMGLFLGGAGHFSQNAVSTKRRRQAGIVTLMEDTSTGGAYEIIGKNDQGQYVGMTADDRQVFISPENVGEVSKISFAEFDKFTKVYPKTEEEAEILRQDIEKAQFKQSRVDEVNSHVDMVSHNNNADVIKVMDDQDGIWWVKDGDVDNVTKENPLVLIDSDGDTRMSDGKDIEVVDISTVPKYLDVIMEGLNAEAGIITQEQQEQPEPFVVGDPVTMDGVQGVITDASDPAEGLTVTFEDAEGNQDVQFVTPDQYHRFQQEEEAIPEEEVVSEPEVKRQTLKAKAGKGDKDVSVIQNEDGSYQVEDVFTSKSYAGGIKNSLNKRYPNTVFEVEDITDKTYDFAEAQFIIKGKSKITPERIQTGQEITKEEVVLPVTKPVVEDAKVGPEIAPDVTPQLIIEAPTEKLDKPTEPPVRLNDTPENILDQVQSINKESLNKRRRTNITGLNKRATDLGLKLEQGDGYFLKLTDQEGKEYKRKAEKEDIELRDPADYSDNVQDFINKVTLSIDNLRGVEIGKMSPKEKAQAVKNIKDGKQTKAATRLMNALEEINNSGKVQLLQDNQSGRPREKIDLDNYISSITDEDVFIDDETEIEVDNLEIENLVQMQELADNEKEFNLAKQSLEYEEEIQRSEPGATREGIIPEEAVEEAGEAPAIETEPTGEEVAPEAAPELTPVQQREVTQRTDELDETIKQKKKDIGAAKSRLQAKKNELAKRQVTQATLGEEPKPTKAAGDLLFEKPKKDFSQDNIKSAISDLEGDLDSRARELKDLVEKRDKVVEDIISSTKAQGRIEMPEKPVKAKEPWEMTKDEFFEKHASVSKITGEKGHGTDAVWERKTFNNESELENYVNNKIAKGKYFETQLGYHDNMKTFKDNDKVLWLVEHNIPGGSKEFIISTKREHEYFIKKAISEGEQVPKEVLADYPELSKTKPAGDILKEAPKKDDDVRLKTTKLGLFSPTEAALSNIQQNKATPEQWKAMLLKNGAKQAELDWMGLDEFIQDKKSLTKEDIQAWIDSNKVEVKETVLGEASENDIQTLLDDEVGENMSREDAIEYLKNEEDAVKFSEHTLPGGKNYKEVLLTMPISKEIRKAYSNLHSYVDYLESKYPNIDNLFSAPILEKTASLSEQKKLKTFVDISNKADESGRFTSPHFKEPNIAVHVRMNDRVDKDGNSVLFIEELQSDWAQKGKKEGFGPLTETEEQELEILTGKLADLEVGLTDKEGIRQSYLLSKKRDKYVPDMPFKQTPQWVGLALKRMIRVASEEGYDKIAWTTGAQQSERYDLSKQVSRVYLKPTWEIDNKGDGAKTLHKGELSVTGRDGSDLIQKTINSASELEELIGKDPAKKLLESPSRMEDDVHVLEGEDLKISSRGMLDFYDKIIPSTLSKITKKFGGKVEKSEIGDAESEYNVFRVPYNKEKPFEVRTKTSPDAIARFATYKEAWDHADKLSTTTVHSLDITPDLGTVAMERGFPMFKNIKKPRTAGEVLSSDFNIKAKELVDRLGKELGTDIITVQTASKLPKSIQAKAKKITAKGFVGVYDRNTSKVYIVLDQANDLADITKTVLHEVVGHKGIEALLGDQYYKVLDGIYNSMSQEDVKRLGAANNTNDPNIIADEYLAEQAENDKRPDFITRAIAKIREMLRRIFGIEYNNNDITVLLANSKRGLQKVAVAKKPAPVRAGDMLKETKGQKAPGFRIVGTEASLSDPKLNNRLTNAIRLEKEGKTARKIFLATGWEKGKDGLWRIDLPDNNLKLINVDNWQKAFNANIGKNKYIGGKLIDYISPKWEGFNEYPEIKDYKIRFFQEEEEGTGIYLEKTIFINTFRSKTRDLSKGVLGKDRHGILRSVILHELQHGIQEIEGFAKGANIKNIFPENTLKKYQGYSNKQIFDRFNQVNPNWKEQYPTLESGIIDGSQKSKAITILAYLDVSGEVEARNVVARDKMSETIRKLTPISETEDTPRSKQRAGDMLKGEVALKQEKKAEDKTYREYPKDKNLDLFERNQEKENLPLTHSSVHFEYEPGLRHIYKDPTSYDEVQAIYDKQGYLNEGYLPNHYDPSDFQLKEGYVAARNSSDTETPGVYGTATSDDFVVYFEGEHIADIYDGVIAKVVKPLDVWEKTGREFKQIKKAPISVALKAKPQTETPAFQKWFGKSKVVDKNGKPLVVYHGTKGVFNAFTRESKGKTGDFGQIGSGFYFTNDFENARNYARNSEGVGSLDVKEVYLNIRNPFIQNKPFDSTRPVSKEKAEKVAEDLQRKGYDGIKYDTGFGPTWHVAFSPTQIKSATGNIGTFDPKSPDIRLKPIPEKPVKVKRRVLAGDMLKDDKPPTTGPPAKLPPVTSENASWEPSLEPIDLSSREKVMKVLQDREMAIKKFQEKVVEKGGEIPEYMELHDAIPRAAGQNRTAIEDFNEKLGKPLLQSIADIENETGVGYARTSDYLYAREALSRNAHISARKGLEDLTANWSGMDEATAKKIIKNYEAEVPATLRKKLIDAKKKVTDFTIDQWRDAGFITPEEHAAYKKRSEYYVPLRGWKDGKADDVFEYINQDLDGAFNPNIYAKGRESKADDPLPYMFSMAHSAVVSGNKNKMKQRLLNIARKNYKKLPELINFAKVYEVQTPTGDWVETKPMEKPKQELFNPVYEVYKNGKWEETASKPSQSMLESGKARLVREKLARVKHDKSYTQRATARQAKQHLVEVWENGTKYFITSDPQVANALNGLTTQLGPGWSHAARFTRFWSSLTTSQNPMFIVPNIVRDYRFGYRSVVIKYGLKAGAKYTANYKKSSGAAWRFMNGKSDPVNNKEDALYQKWREKGGPTGYVQLNKVDRLKKSIERDLKDLKTTNATLNPFRYLNKLRRFETKLIGGLADWSESIGRYSAFKIALENGATMDQAATFSKEITVNFDRKGQWGQHIGALYAFWNARMQGVTRYFKLWGMDPKKMAMFAAMDIAAGISLSMMLDWFWGDDKDEDGVKKYDKFSSFLRRGYLMIPIPGTGNTVSLPNPHGFGAFYAIGNIAYEMATGRKSATVGAMETFDSFTNSMMPIDLGAAFAGGKGQPSLRPFVPTFAVPLMDIARNEDFAGRAIYREPYVKDQNIADSKLYFGRVNTVIKGLTDQIFKLGGGDPELGIRQRITKEGEIKEIKQVFDWNPAKIEHILEYYLSGKGQFYNKLYKSTIQTVIEGQKRAVEEGLKGNEVVKQTFKDLITQHPGDVPIVNRFLRVGHGDPIRDEYYKKRKSLGTYLELSKKFEGIQDFDKVNLLYGSEKMPEAMMFGLYDKQISGLNEMLYQDIPQSAKDRIKKQIRDIQKKAINFKEK